MFQSNPLFQSKTSCCACGACVAACPLGIIDMKLDEYGFLYPVVDAQVCISCGKCVSVCSILQQPPLRKPLDAYVASYCLIDTAKHSASGGIFAALAQDHLARGGIVYGTAFTEDFTAKVIGITRMEDLSRLQGSKYTQSRMDCFAVMETEITSGRPVLFCGTPCQAAALRTYFGRDHKNLLIADIVCHGVPGNQMFRDYITHLEKKRNIQLTDYRFRDKNVKIHPDGSITHEQDVKAKLTYRKNGSSGKTEIRREPASRSAYYKLFLNNATFRDSCYQCPYAQSSRVGDVTICDYWGSDPEIRGYMAAQQHCGVSGLLVNTPQGQEALRRLENQLILKKTTPETIAENNHQLSNPSTADPDRSTILDLYRTKGYAGVEQWYQRKYFLYLTASKLTASLPKGLRSGLIQLWRKLKL